MEAMQLGIKVVEIEVRKKISNQANRTRNRLCPCLAGQGKASSVRLGELGNGTKHDLCCSRADRLEKDDTLCKRPN